MVNVSFALSCTSNDSNEWTVFKKPWKSGSPEKQCYAVCTSPEKLLLSYTSGSNTDNKTTTKNAAAVNSDNVNNTCTRTEKQTSTITVKQSASRYKEHLNPYVSCKPTHMHQYTG